MSRFWYGVLAMLLAGGLAACGSSDSVGGSGGPKADSIGHVFVIVLENKSYDLTFGADTEAPYLGQTLPTMGALLEEYYGIGHNSLDNYIAMISGQGPNVSTQADCPTLSDFATGAVVNSNGQIVGAGCIYPTNIASIADEFRSAGISWKGYMQDMGNDPSRYDPALAASDTRPQGPRTCGHGTIGRIDQTQSATATDQYATRHDPFMYFHNIIDDQTYCDEHVVNLDDAFVDDLKSTDTTPAFSFITPNLCDDGHDANCADGTVGGLTGIDRFLKQWVPVILNSPAYKKDGLLIITYDESTGFTDDSTACCGESGTISQLFLQPGITGPGGGRVGAVLISPFITPGTVSTLPYNHYSLLRSISDIFGVAYLGHAADGDTAAGTDCDNETQPCSFGSDVYSAKMPVFPARPAS
ncbi:alkaline phosphatase family protein [Solimonas marina]|uniref:Phosphoesterase n=1 Tax=Solimonas marina TaxID=2714601 RepID=A0A969WAB1_9GAMM|nr:alkaline phosphatase family protein [Solimonas marina]NKF22799.1 phosphoesterase [Solimonas marina]